MEWTLAAYTGDENGVDSSSVGPRAGTVTLMPRSLMLLVANFAQPAY